MSGRILFIATSHNELGSSSRKTGIWAEELAIPYLAFKGAGYQVDIATPRGGATPLDPASIKPKGGNGSELERFLADEIAQHKSSHTLRVADVDVHDYDAVFFPGGHGAMWDLPSDAHVAGAVQTAFAAGKVVGAVCHGVAGLVGARTPEGRSVVAGRRINSFTDQEEAAAGLIDVVPFALETRLRELGGRFEGAPNWTSFAVRDGRLVTGQNPASSLRVAELMLETLRVPATAA